MELYYDQLETSLNEKQLTLQLCAHQLDPPILQQLYRLGEQKLEGLLQKIPNKY